MPALARIEPPWDQRLARLMVGPLRQSPITPNAITTSTIVFGLLGAWLLARGGAAVHLGAALAMIAFLLDHADGELARLTGRTSTFGHYYDLFADALVMSALFIGIGLGAGGLGSPAVRLGMIAAGGVAVAMLFRMELERRAGKIAVRQPSLLGVEAQDVLYLVGPVTWLGGLETFLMLAAIGAPLYALAALWDLGRYLRQLGSLP